LFIVFVILLQIYGKRLVFPSLLPKTWGELSRIVVLFPEISVVLRQIFRLYAEFVAYLFLCRNNLK